MKCLTKILLITAIFAGILFLTTCYFAVEFENTRNNLEKTQKELEITTEKLKSTQIDFNNLKKKNDELCTNIDELNEDLRTLKATLAELNKEEYELKYIGNFKISYYCDERRNHICGGNGITKSGEATEVNWTAAADWGVLPNGSIVYISGVGYRKITDIGGAVDGKHIDVLVKSHQEALKLGIHYEDVWVLVKKGS